MVLLLNNELKKAAGRRLLAMETICSRALAEHGWPQTAEISLTICDNMIQAPNKEWRGVDAATDVLSFPLITPDGGFNGYIFCWVISFRWNEQAADYNHSLERGIIFYPWPAAFIGLDHEEEQRSRQCVWRKRNSAGSRSNVMKFKHKRFKIVSTVPLWFGMPGAVNGICAFTLLLRQLQLRPGSIFA